MFATTPEPTYTAVMVASVHSGADVAAYDALAAVARSGPGDRLWQGSNGGILRQTGRMRDWLVGGGLILGPEGLLLVRNRRRNGSVDWSPPGGVIDDGETLIDGLSREVAEETGVVVSGWKGPMYEVVVEAPGLGWRLRVEAHMAVDFAGELAIDDPDGIVEEVMFVAPDACVGRLDGCHPWVAEPLAAWLAERWDDGRSFRYHVDGVDMAGAVVTRR